MKNQEKLCPFALSSNSPDNSCEYENCQWWDYNNRCCCIVTISKALEAVGIIKWKIIEEAKKEKITV